MSSVIVFVCVSVCPRLCNTMIHGGGTVGGGVGDDHLTNLKHLANLEHLNHLEHLSHLDHMGQIMNSPMGVK